MGKKLRFHRRTKTGRHSKKTSEAKDNPTNLPDPSETKPTEKTEKFTKENAPQSKDDPSNPPPSPGQTPTEDNPKDPPHPTKEPNPSINLDSGSNDEECANSNKEGNATTIRKLPSSTQKPLINATPPKKFQHC